MDKFNMSEHHHLIFGIGWVQFVPINDDKLLCACEKCCLRDSGECGSVKCCAHERLDRRNGYYVKVPKKRVNSVKKVLRWFGL